ncbi:MAG: S1 RNA-binding domain-containing protein, partial [Myxococcota bacterium]
MSEEHDDTTTTDTEHEEVPEASPEPQESAEQSAQADGTVDGDEDEVEKEDDLDAAQAPDGGQDRRRGRRRRERRPPELPDVGGELMQLLELATRYPDIIPPVSEIALKVGREDLSARLLRVGLQSERPSVEFYVSAAHLARKESDPNRVVELVHEALETFAPDNDETPDLTEELDHRFLELVRLGFAAMLFDLGGVEEGGAFGSRVAQALPRYAQIFMEDPQFHVLRAQAMWFVDRDKSEEIWEHAVVMRDAESTWNARGTWYKEAERELIKAEGAYRDGVKIAPESSLLLHNLAQVLMDRAEQEGDLKATTQHQFVSEADKLLRQAMRAKPRRRLHRHIRATFDRLKRMRRDLPDAPQVHKDPPKVGDRVRGRVRSLTVYGAFLSIDGGYSGLLHKSEMAHERIDDPATLLHVGDHLEVEVIESRDEGNGRWRIGFSRRSVLPEPTE